MFCIMEYPAVLESDTFIYNQKKVEMKNNCENDELKEYRKAVEHYERDKKDYLFHNGAMSML